MNHNVHLSILICLLLFIFSPSVRSQSAEVQFVHGAADPSIKVVDLWIDSVKVFDDLEFRHATPFLQVASNTLIEIALCDSNSTSATNPLWTSTDSLEGGGRIINSLIGLLDSTAGYDPYVPLSWVTLHNVPVSSASPGQVEIHFLQSVTDVSEASVIEFRAPLGTLTDVDHGAYSTGQWFDPSHYRLRMKDANGSDIYREASLLLHTLSMVDSVGLVLMTGFAHPTSSSQPKVQFQLVRASGEVETLPITTGKLQCIHNAADPTLSRVDVFIDGERIFDNLSFQAASGSTTLSSGVNHLLVITSDSAGSSQEVIISDTISVMADGKVLSVTSGTIHPTLNAMQPIRHTWRPIYESSPVAGETSVLSFNGGHDQASMTLYESSLLDADFTSSLPFATFSSYVQVPPTDYKVDLVDAISDSILHTYSLNLPTYGLSGASVVLMSSGWKDTTLLSGLEPIGMWLARNVSGKMIELPQTVGLGDINQSSLVAYPIPADRGFQIYASTPLGKIRMYSADGRLIYAHQSNLLTERIDTQSLPNGWYILNVEDGQRVYRKKLVIQH